MLGWTVEPWAGGVPLSSPAGIVDGAWGGAVVYGDWGMPARPEVTGRRGRLCPPTPLDAAERARRPDHGRVEVEAPLFEPWNAACRVAEDAAVGGHQPVPATVGRGRHAHDRLVELQDPAEPRMPRRRS